jgi:hypothetical protein
MTHWWNGWSPRTAAPVTAGRALRLEGLEPTAVGELPAAPNRAASARATPSVFSSLVRLELPGTLAVGLPADVFAPDGRLVRTLDPDRSSWQWDGTDAAGRHVPAGVYLIAVRGTDGFGRVVFTGR